ncbi:MAG: oxidoreductase [Gemmatimonas sp.]|nr:oxidoreductase [Gemmatimonas sp.]
MTAAESGSFALGGDLPVHRLGYGAMRITGKGIFGPPADLDGAIRVLRRAVELDINLIDTAESYGPHVSEELIAKALSPYPDDLVIATKGGMDRPAPGRWKANGRPERLRAELEGSLRRLRLERIDLWQLHRIDPDVPEDEQFGVIQEFIREGLVRHVGLSEVTVDQIERASGSFEVATVQNRYNLFDREWDDVVEYCESHGIGFIPWFPLNVGKLDDGGELAAVAAERRATPAQIALAWLLKRSPMILPIPGTSSVAHLDENTEAAAVQLSDEQFARLS